MSTESKVGKEGMLFIVDAQNLYYSARELFGRGSRIDFKKLKSRVVGDRQFSVIYGVAFVPEIRDDTKSLIKALQRFGYEPVPREENFDIQVAKLSSIMETFQVVAIASGDGVFLPLCEAARAKGKRVEVYSFVDAVNSEIPGKADAFVYLKADILMGDFSTITTPAAEDKEASDGTATGSSTSSS